MTRTVTVVRCECNSRGSLLLSLDVLSKYPHYFPRFSYEKRGLFALVGYSMPVRLRRKATNIQTG